VLGQRAVDAEALGVGVAVEHVGHANDPTGRV
jgi:hypothetical protein